MSLREVVAIPTGTLLEIMNYNVEGQQYACAGELIGLQAMTNVLNLIQKIDIAKLTETFSIEKVKEILRFRNHTLSIHDTFGQVFFPSVHTCPKRSIPHNSTPTCSSIPNLVAKPFQVSREYVQLIYGQTSSPRLDKVLKKWGKDNYNCASPEQRQMRAYIIFVELLAYQCASPVRRSW